MAIQTAQQLKAAFSAGKFPTQADYSNLIDTIVGMAGSDSIVTISLGYSGSFSASDMESEYTLDGNGYITNPEKPLNISTLISKHNEYAGVPSVTANTKIVIIDNQSWFYYVHTTTNQNSLFVRTSEISEGDFGGRTGYVDTEIPEGRIGVFARGKSNIWKLVGGGASSSSNSNNVQQPVILGATPGVKQILGGRVGNNSITWNGNQNSPIWVDELIKACLANQGIESSYDDLSSVVISNVGLFSSGYNQNIHTIKYDGNENDYNIYVRVSSAQDGDSNTLTAIPLNGSTMFVKLPSINRDDWEDSSSPYYMSDLFNQGLDEIYLSNYEGVDSWKIVGPYVGVTMAELNAKTLN